MDDGSRATFLDFPATIEANREKLGAGGMDKIAACAVTFGKNLAISASKLGLWCARRDSNPHDFTHCHLKAARLPIPPRALWEIDGICARSDQDPIETGSTAPM
jgi:hypothetical protein